MMICSLEAQNPSIFDALQLYAVGVFGTVVIFRPFVDLSSSVTDILWLNGAR